MSGNIQQSGSITPGHLVTWTTNNVVQDGGAILASQKVLASLRSADFNTTADQPLVLPSAVTALIVSQIIVTNASTSLTTVRGGFYPGALKQAPPIVDPSQDYTALTGATIYMNPFLSTYGQTTRFSSTNLPLVLSSNNQYALSFYLSLTTAQGTPATADVYVVGIDLT